MKIKSLHLKNFRCFEDFEIDFNTGDQERGGLTVLVAKNGEGKTAILDAINVAWGPFFMNIPNTKAASFCIEDAHKSNDGNLIGLPMLNATIENPPSFLVKFPNYKNFRLTRELVEKRKGFSTTSTTETTTDDHWHLNNYATYLLTNQNPNEPWPLFAYYGDDRLFSSVKLDSSAETVKLTDNPEYGYEGAITPKKSYYAEFCNWFAKLEFCLRDEKINRDEGVPQLDENTYVKYQKFDVLVKKAIEDALQPTGWTNIGYMNNTKEIVVWRKEHQERIPISRLSAGNRMTIGMIGDLAFRCCRLNSNKNMGALIATPGIVLIDEIELHLHPSWQQQILPTLQKIFPKIQFIVTTHSPQVISSVPAECVRIIDNGNVYGAVGTEGAESSRILTRIFGTEAYPKSNPVRQKLMEYLDLVYKNQWKSPRAQELRRDLDQIYQGEEPLLFEADLHIENEEWEEAHPGDDEESIANESQTAILNVCEPKQTYDAGEGK